MMSMFLQSSRPISSMPESGSRWTGKRMFLRDELGHAALDDDVVGDMDEDTVVSPWAWRTRV